MIISNTKTSALSYFETPRRELETRCTDSGVVLTRSYAINSQIMCDTQHNCFKSQFCFILQCLGWSWYLANDMQFYVISPLLLYVIHR